MRILYLHSTVVPPPTDLRMDRFFLLSENLEGDVLQPVWFHTPEEVEAVFGPGSYPSHTVGKFRYHWILSSNIRTMRERFKVFGSYLKVGLRLHRERPFDCIVAYSHMTTGLLAGVLKLLTGAKLIIEIATSPNLIYITERPDPGLRERLLKAYSDTCLHLSVFLATRMHLLYATQLAPYRLLRNARASVFHEFVPVSVIDRPPAEEARERYVLLSGAPWYLKGVDVLIQAFHKIAPDFPDVKLVLLGHFPDRTQIDKLVAGSTQIKVLKAVPNVEALEIIRRATIFVLPSRCEGMGRVLIEAMAAGIPLIGSDIGGIPSMISPNENGFLIPSGDVEALSARLRELLSNPALCRRLGDNGYRRAHQELNEQVYVRAFTAMIKASLTQNHEFIN
jgi:glycosyltransferase involved in cell wall biosynthesis